MAHQDPKDETRETLLRVARSLFAKHGLDGVTVRDIAEAAGQNVSAVSYYFEGKEGLYRAVIEDFAKSKQASAQAMLGTAKSCEEFKVLFRMLIAQFLNDVMESPEGCQIILKEIDAGLPLVADIFEKTLLNNFKMIVRFIEEHQEKGFLRREVPPQLVPIMIQGIVFHLQRSEGIRKRFFKESLVDPKARQQTAEAVCTILLDGLVVKSKE